MITLRKIGLGLGIVAGMALVWHSAKNTPEKTTTEGVQPPLVEVKQVVPQQHTPQIIIPAVTSAFQTADLKAETSGRLTSIDHAKQNHLLPKGAIVARVDAGSLPEQIKAHKSKILYFEQQVVADKALQAKGFSYKSKTLKLASDLADERAALATAQDTYQKTLIQMPFKGTLNITYGDVGSLVAPGTLVAQAIDLQKIKVRGAVPETSFFQGRQAVQAQIHVTTDQGTSIYPAGIQRFSQGANLQTHAFEVEAIMDNTQAQVPAGYSVQMALQLPPVKAYQVPHQALTLDDKDRIGVKIMHKDQVVFVPVVVVDETKSGVWVMPITIPSNPLPSWRVIISGQENVQDGGMARVGALS